MQHQGSHRGGKRSIKKKNPAILDAVREKCAHPCSPQSLCSSLLQGSSAEFNPGEGDMKKQVVVWAGRAAGTGRSITLMCGMFWSVVEPCVGPGGEFRIGI